MNIAHILSLAAISPSGLPDKNAIKKFNEEMIELQEALDSQDKSFILEEAVDCVYFLIKEIHLISSITGIEIDDILKACEVKYTLRFITNGRVKIKEEERDAMMEVVYGNSYVS